MRATHNIVDFLSEFALLAHKANALATQLAEASPKECETHILSLVKGRERYVWLYRDGQRCDVLRSLGHCASNPDLSFTWYDAAVLSQKLQQTKDASAHGPRSDGGGIKPHL